MERKEPTLSGANNEREREEATFRRQPPPAYDDARPVRSGAPSSSPLPAIALGIALLGVCGAAFLGFQLMEAQQKLEKDSARIAQLESQLNLTSSESTQSVTALGINLQKLDTEVKRQWEAEKKSNGEHDNKFANLSKAIDGTKAEINSVKADNSSLKQEIIANKASQDELLPRIDNLDKNIAEQRKKIADVSSSINAMLTQIKSAEGLAARITKTEEAIDAIEDNRRTINKDLLQIKQQLGIK